MELFSKMIATALGVAVHQVNNTLSLLAGGATIPFISRYRKEATGGLDEVQIGEIKDRNDKLCELSKRKETILSTIDTQGKLYFIIENNIFKVSHQFTLYIFIIKINSTFPCKKSLIIIDSNFI